MFLFMVALTLRGGREEAPPLGGIKNHEKLRGVGGPRVTDQSFTVFFTANMVIKSGVRKIVLKRSTTTKNPHLSDSSTSTSVTMITSVLCTRKQR